MIFPSRQKHSALPNVFIYKIFEETASFKVTIIIIVQNHIEYKVTKVLSNKVLFNSRVELVSMDDVQAPPVGTKGTILGVDDTGSIMVAWDNGSSLNVIFQVDRIRLI